MAIGIQLSNVLMVVSGKPVPDGGVGYSMYGLGEDKTLPNCNHVQACLRDLRQVDVDVERLIDVRALMGSNAQFKSAEQAGALQIVSQWRGDLLVIMRTGAGTSLLFMAPSMNPAEQALLT
ncbi:hypothetical protein BKA93DRAFT_746677 [Sparassis latifolia]